jgi:formylglycine-generating enzyme required for sulfatase activity
MYPMKKTIRLLVAFSTLILVLLTSYLIFGGRKLQVEEPLFIGSQIVNSADGAVLVAVPAGEFIMGRDFSDDYYARLEHPVYLDGFWIYQTEVTFAQYEKCIAAKKCDQPHASYYGDPFYDDYPVEYITWFDARDYCKWAGVRLPSEAEWEKAARGTEGFKYPWGNTWDASLLNAEGSEDGYIKMAPVGSFQGGASPYGALDMTGNVWEMVEDKFAAQYYSNSPGENPSGPVEGNTCVRRGGSWYQNETFSQVSYRAKEYKTHRHEAVGFRCAVSP